MRTMLLLTVLILGGCAGRAPLPEAVSTPPAFHEALRPIEVAPLVSAPLDLDKTLTRIAFGSCAHQLKDQRFWDAIAADRPDLTLLLGDNVYGDVYSGDPALPELKAAYMRLGQSAPFARLRASVPVIAGWDDHDYGMNDAGGDYQYKEQTEALFEHVWALDGDDPRRARPGVYRDWIIGAEDGARVQIIMLDTRFFRSPLKATDQPYAKGKERYVPDADPKKTMLGAAQWAWLEEALRKPADLRLLVSSVQVISDGHGWEGWKMLPSERQRLYDLIAASEAKNLMILSGDRHSASFYRKDRGSHGPIFEATASAFNVPAADGRRASGETYVEPGPNRITDMYYEANYGALEIDWTARTVTVEIRQPTGQTVFSETIGLTSQ